MFGIYRFILAFNVVLFHILKVPQIGSLAVYSFFILSGYLMTYIMHHTYGYSYKGVKLYALNRFYRLFPVYWALMLVTVFVIMVVGNDFASTFHIAMRLPQDITELIINITMVYPDFSPSSYTPRLAPATWALTIELFFYLLIGLGISKSKLRTNIWFTCSICYVLYNNILLKQYGLDYGNFISASLPFSIGAMLFFHKNTIQNLLLKFHLFKLRTVTSLFTFNVIFCSTVVFIFPEQSWKIVILCKAVNLVLSAVMVIKLSETKSDTPLIKSIDKFTGDLSYPVYVFHWAAACFASWLLYTSPQKGPMAFTIGLVLTIVVSVIVNKFINDKIELLRRKVKKSPAALTCSD